MWSCCHMADASGSAEQACQASVQHGLSLTRQPAQHCKACIAQPLEPQNCFEHRRCPFGTPLRLCRIWQHSKQSMRNLQCL